MITKQTVWYSGIAMLATAAILNACDDTSNEMGNQAPGPTPELPSAQALGGFSLDCINGQQQQQQQSKQVPFQQQQSCVQQSMQQVQQVQFVNSTVADFDVTLDCRRRIVVIRNKGQDEVQGTLPILRDGTVQGQLTLQQQLADDGKGSGLCWVEYIVTFSGTATCDGLNPIIPPGASPSPGAPVIPKVNLTTTVSLDPSNFEELEAAGIDVFQVVPAPSAVPSPEVTILSNGTGGALSLSPVVDPTEAPSEAPPEEPGTQGSPSPSPIASASPGPSLSPSPSASPSVSPSPSPSLSPSPSPSVSPSPSPSPSLSPRPPLSPRPSPSVSMRPPVVTPVKFCLVENVCPFEGKTDLSCK